MPKKIEEDVYRLARIAGLDYEPEDRKGDPYIEERVRKGQDNYEATLELLAKILESDLLFGSFITHDKRHLENVLIEAAEEIFSEDGAPEIRKELMRNKEEFLEIFRRINESPSEIIKGAYYTDLIIRDIGTAETGELLREPTNPKMIAEDILRLLQMKYIENAYTLKKPTVTNQNQLVLQAEEVETTIPPGLLFSIMFNPLNNCLEKFREESTLPNQGFKAGIGIAELSKTHFAIYIHDNGKAPDLNKLKEYLRKYEAPEELKGHVEKWKKSPYQINDLTVGDLTKLMFTTRYSPAEVENKAMQTFSKGIGLKGLEHILNHAAGRVLYGELYSDGGPVFTIILPKNPPRGWLEKNYKRILTEIYSAREREKAQLNYDFLRAA